MVSVIGGIFLLLILFYALLYSSYVQTSLVNYFTYRIEQKTGAKIKIGGVDFRPMKSLVLNDMLLTDYRSDTLFYCENFRVKIDSFRLSSRSFSVRDITLDNAYFNLWIVRGEEKSVMNLDIFLDSLASSGKSSTSIDWLVGIGTVHIQNSRFKYRENVYDTVRYGINWTDVGCRQVNADISDIDFSGGKVRAKVSGMSFVEKSGFAVEDLEAKVDCTDSMLLITEGEIKTERSSLNLNKLEFKWKPNRRDWRYFTTRMQQYYCLGADTYVSFIDLAYFNANLLGIENTIRCSGVVSNTVNRLEGHNLKIAFGESSVFNGHFKSHGLPDFWHTVFEIDFQDASIRPADLQTIYLPWLKRYIPVPEPLHHWKQFELKGKFKGTVEDFVLQANSTTPGFKGNLLFTYAPGLKTEEQVVMDGHFNFPAINFGRLANTSVCGFGSFGGTYAGEMDRDKINFHVKGNIRNLSVGKGKIRNTDIFLTWEDEDLNLMAFVEEEKVNLAMTLNMAQTDSTTFCSSKGNLAISDLNGFGWGITDSLERVSTTFDFVYGASKQENSLTHLGLSDLFYANSRDSFSIAAFDFENRVREDYYTTTLFSDVADLLIEGRYLSIRPLEFTRKLIKSYLPAYVMQKKKTYRKVKKENVDFHYDIQVKDAEKVLRVLYPSLQIAPGTRLCSAYDGVTQQMNLSLESDSIGYGEIRLIRPSVRLDGDGEDLNIISKAEQLAYMDWSKIYNVRNEIKVSDNNIKNKLQWCNWTDQTYSGELSADVNLVSLSDESYRTELTIHPGIVILSDSVWQVGEAQVVYEDNNLSIRNFRIYSYGQAVAVDGKISKDPADSLSLQLSRFNLSELNRLVFNNRLNIFGILDGKMILWDYYKDNLIYSQIRLENWGINSDTLGTLRLQSYWDADSNRMFLGAENRVKNEVPLQVAGYYSPHTESLDVGVRLKKVGMERLRKYMADYLTQSQGEMSGEIRIKGDIAQPDFNGYLSMKDVKLGIRDLNTSFAINDTLFLDKSQLILRNFKIWDEEGNKAEGSGNYRFWDNTYALNFTFRQFLLLNTNALHNEAFYGKIYLSGLLNADNTAGVTNVTLNVRPESNSELFLPLSSAWSEEDGNFLHFVNDNQPQRRKNRPYTTQKGMVVNANLELNDNLKVQIVFDPAIGDVLKANGNGDIRVALDQDGGINMFGEYKITKGSYLFTLGGIFNKSFVLSPGGSIVWNGSPYDAIMDISAVYNLKTSLNELLSSTNSLSDRSTKVPVECILGLSDNFTNPLVKFDINFPSLDSQTKSIVQSLFSSQDEINKQVFSLLMLNKFYKPDYMNNTEVAERNMGYQAGVTTASEMVSNQLSRWLSRISNNFDIDFSYRPGDDITADEIELALSTQFLNDRVTFTANGNMDVGATKNVTSGSSANNIAGDFDVDVKLNKQGTLKLKAYSHTDEKIIYKNNSETIQGVGISYQETFDTFRELLHKYFSFFRSKSKKNENK